MQEWALKYAHRGWPVFPLHGIISGQCTCGTKDCPDAGKHPIEQRWAKSATTDETKITEWFADKAYNIGLITGRTSGITVLDIDIGPGKLGAQTWSNITAEFGEPITLTANTGGGGMHLFFVYNSAIKTSSNVLGPGIDCRNDGGYVVAAPSLHRSGRIYRWLAFDEKLDFLPAYLLPQKKSSKKKKQNNFTLDQVSDMLNHVPAEDRDTWRKVGIILGREFGDDAAWDVYVEWAARWSGKKGRNHAEIMKESFYKFSKEPGDLTIASIYRQAIQGGWSPRSGRIPVEHFLYYLPDNKYIYRPTREFWVGSGIDAACGQVNHEGELLPATGYLQQTKAITSITSDPSIAEEIILGHDCQWGTLMKVHGAATFNTYRPPIIEPGDAKLASPFLNHVRKVFNKKGDAEVFLDYMAHRVQRPGQKIRFALLIVGEQGVGKDTAIGMCAPAIGIWNISNIDPNQLEQGFNEYVAAVLVVISEAANVQEMSKWKFNERLKTLIAGGPDNITVNPKYGKKFSIRLHCGVIITTNHVQGSIYIPEDDRRYDVISAANRAECSFLDRTVHAQYFEELWEWYNDGGSAHIAALLQQRDLTKFNPNEPSRRTEAHKMMVLDNYNGDTWLIDAIDALDNPAALRIDVLRGSVDLVKEGLTAIEFNRKVAFALERAGYIKYVNPNEKNGRWSVSGTKHVVYRRKDVTDHAAIADCISKSGKF